MLFSAVWLWSALTAPILLFFGRIVYNVFFHPLRKFPGPAMAGATGLWRAYREVLLKQNLGQELLELHKQYGDIVRVSPNELHFGNPTAFHEIYHLTKRWDKDDELYNVTGFKSGSFVYRKYAKAKERREVLMPMFSKKAIQNIEGLVWQNAAKLASAITKMNATQQSIDLLFAFRSFTLDTIMSFTFGNNIGALDAPQFRDPLILGMDATLPALPLLKNFSWVRKLTYAFPPTLVMQLLPNADAIAPRVYQVRDVIHRQLQAVLNSPEKLEDAQHQTIFHRMLDARAWRTKVVPDLTELHDEGFTLVFAGSNTVADTLIMGHWHLLRKPDLLRALRAELLTVWPSLAGGEASRPSLADLEALPLLTATVKESLRFIPSGVSLTRVVPAQGAVICGRHIPGGAAVGMGILHVHQSEAIFEDALDFNPARWLPGEHKKEKNLEHWLVPFSRGPRACFGVNLSMCELYIAYATMLRHFDMSLDGTTEEDMQWRECIAAAYPRRHLHAWCSPAEA
ncbi:Cytochrome P450 monooxygenase yanH [Apiospora marii]|uniref:Cytochrome P450 monooxygenase yanH n=1 Tax=Apiospora marii TaxID=335849 RepID=UPI00313028DF